MAMVDVVSYLPTGVFMAQAGRLGPNFGVDSHLALLYIRHTWTGWTLAMALSHDDSTINIVLSIKIISIIF